MGTPTTAAPKRTTALDRTRSSDPAATRASGAERTMAATDGGGAGAGGAAWAGADVAGATGASFPGPAGPSGGAGSAVLWGASAGSTGSVIVRRSAECGHRLAGGNDGQVDVLLGVRRRHVPQPARGGVDAARQQALDEAGMGGRVARGAVACVPCVGRLADRRVEHGPRMTDRQARRGPAEPVGQAGHEAVEVRVDRGSMLGQVADRGDRRPAGPGG